MQVMLCCRNVDQREGVRVKNIKETSQKHLTAIKQSLLYVLEWIAVISVFVCESSAL